MKLKQIVAGFIKLVNETKENDIQNVINGSVLGVIDSFFVEINDNILKQKMTKDTQVIGLLISYHEKWKGFAKGVNFNLKHDYVRYDGFKIFCMNKFPKYKKVIEIRLV